MEEENKSKRFGTKGKKRKRARYEYVTQKLSQKVPVSRPIRHEKVNKSKILKSTPQKFPRIMYI